MTIAELLKMPVGQKIGGGFVLTVKKTKKSVQLPSKQYIHTVVLFDKTGEMLADFKDPSPTGYNPIKKGTQVSVIVAEIQAADFTGREKVSQTGTKLYVDQYNIPTQIGEPYLEDDFPDWRVTVRGKIRMHVTCSFIQAGKEINKAEIEQLTEYIMNGGENENPN